MSKHPPRKKKVRKSTAPRPASRSDLTGYAALIGESFATRIDLLERVIQESHYPSLGRYKERLLARTIRDFIPRIFEVGTGFVLFPHEDPSPPGGPDHHDLLNRSAFSVSRQCDILIYEAATVPPIFKDDDFVVIRPEAVRAVIEVKGSLSLPETQNILDSFIDFGRKWRATQLFYETHHQALPSPPALLAMAWQIYKKPNGVPVTTPVKIRERVAKVYKEHVTEAEPSRFPVLKHLFIYDSCVISHAFDGETHSEGWWSRDGRFIRFDQNAKAYRDRDCTIATLLAALHLAIGRDTFNRFFSYVVETNQIGVVPYPHEGFSPWLEF